VKDDPRRRWAHFLKASVLQLTDRTLGRAKKRRELGEGEDRGGKKDWAGVVQVKTRKSMDPLKKGFSALGEWNLLGKTKTLYARE